MTGFDADTEDAAPIIAPTVLRTAQTTDLNHALADAVDGRDSFPGYPFMVRTFANDNPGATARVLLVDGVTFGDMADDTGLTEATPPPTWSRSATRPTAPRTMSRRCGD